MSWGHILSDLSGSVFASLGSVFVVLGLFFIVTAYIGMVRFPDFLTKIHAAGIVEVIAIPCMVIGIMLEYDISVSIAFKMLLLLVFVYLLSPATSHILAKINLLDGRQPVGKIDEG